MSLADPIIARRYFETVGKERSRIAQAPPVSPADAAKPGAIPNNDVFGYTAAFDEELKKIGQISPDQPSDMR